VASNPLRSLPSLTGDLSRVETELLAAVTSVDPALTEIAQHLILAGGKRVRPSFAVAAGACADTFDGDGAVDGSGGVQIEVIRGGVAVELVHLGSLYHDDVIDEAVTRRTVESVNARWGNLRAILAGDFLLAKASEIAASLGTEVAGLLAATIGRLCEGEIGELSTAYQTTRSREAYLASIEGKTASLFAAAARIGAIVAGLDRDRIDALTRFGTAYGMAFQIIDDVLDLVATDEQLGKPAGHDLVEGVYTLPVLYALEPDRPGAAELADLLGVPIHDDLLARARGIVAAGGGVEAALADARAYAQQAEAALEGFAERPGAQALSAAISQLWGREGLPVPVTAPPPHADR
jgi:heptaprenyl diphosphate synthase